MTDNYSTTVLADKPVGYWRLNEQSLGDQVTDESGRNHHGKIVGNPIMGADGAIANSTNKSITFAANAYLEIPSSTDFSIQTSGIGLSVELWMRPDTLIFPGEGESQYINWLGKGQKDEMEWGFVFYSVDHPKRPNRISAYAWNPQGGLGAGAYCSGSIVKPIEWLHLVACYDNYSCSCSKKPGVHLFVNGVQTKGPPSPGTLYFNEGNWSILPRSCNAPLRIGTRSATPNSYFTGGIDEVAIYPRVLTHEQIKRHYDVGMGS
jgi:Concanavalin A-like lectin/glucanases superfamily